MPFELCTLGTQKNRVLVLRVARILQREGALFLGGNT